MLQAFHPSAVAFWFIKNHANTFCYRVNKYWRIVKKCINYHLKNLHQKYISWNIHIFKMTIA